MKNLNALLPLTIGILMFANFSCNNPSVKDKEESKYEIVYQQKYGMTIVTMCLVGDTSKTVLTDIGRKIIGGNQFAAVYFYTDRSKVKDIRRCTDAMDAMPDDGYIAEYTTMTGFKIGTYKNNYQK